MGTDVIRWDTQRNGKGVDDEEEQSPVTINPPDASTSDGKEKRKVPFMGPPAFDSKKK